MADKDVSVLRKEYEKFSLDPNSLSPDPIEVFDDWFQFAVKSKCTEVNAMTLATVNEQNRPSSRIVLLKDFSTEGFVFFTNYKSRKGHDMERNPYASLNFFWPEIERQVRIEGTVTKVSEAQSTDYFRTRPRLSQVGAIVSNQSQEIPDRREMEDKMAALMNLPETEELQRPLHWGGYLLKPDFIEFWQGRAGRLHDRICYEFKDGNWRKFRLAP